MDAFVTNQIIGTQQSRDPWVEVIDTTIALGAFTGANLNAVNTLNMEFDRMKEEISNLKEELDDVKRQHEAHVENIEKSSKDKSLVKNEELATR